MKTRSIFKIVLAIVIVVVATLSTAGAALVWSEDRAHSDYLSARTEVSSALVTASADGLLPEELAGYSARANHIDGAKAPPGALWGSKLPGFYSRQTKAYRALNAQIRAAVTRAAAQAQLQAQYLIRKLRLDIRQGRSLGMDTSQAGKSLRTATRDLKQAGTPKDYRGIVASLSGPQWALAAAVKARRLYMHTVLAKAGNTQQGVVQIASAQAADSDGKLRLAALLAPKQAAPLTGKVDRLLNAVRDQTTPAGAASKAADLNAVAMQIAAFYARTVPSKMIVVSTEEQVARVYQNGQEIYNTFVTTGGPELPTDHGVFHIYMRASPFEFHSPWPPGSPFYYPPTPVQFWMPFDGGEGLHDASWRSNFGPGSNVAPTNLGDGNVILGTHGCVNLPMDAASFIWNWSDIGTTVIVV